MYDKTHYNSYIKRVFGGREPGSAWPLSGVWSSQDPLGHQLWDIVRFMLTGVWSPQDLQGGDDAEGKDEFNHSDGFLMCHSLFRDSFLDYCV